MSNSNPGSSLRSVNIYITFVLLFILLFSAVISLIVEITSVREAIGPFLTLSGNIRIVPTIFFILAVGILCIILWGFIELLTSHIRFKIFEDELIVVLLKILASFGFITLLSLSLLVNETLFLMELVIFSLIIFYTLILYLILSSRGMFETLELIPILKRFSPRLKALILLFVSIFMIVRIAVFDFIVIISFLQLNIPYLPFPDLFDQILSIFTNTYDSLRSLITSFQLDLLDPLFSWFAPLEALLIKLVVYSLILFRSLGDFTTGVSTGISSGVSTTEVVTTATDTVLDVLEEVDSAIAVETATGQASDIKRNMSISYWTAALSLFGVFFLEVVLLLVDGELSTNYGEFMDLMLSFIVWILVFFLGIKKLFQGK